MRIMCRSAPTNPRNAAACDATILTIQSGIPVARIELLDELQVRACNLYSKLALPELPMLFIVSQVEVRPAPPDVEAHNEARPRVTIERAPGVKCERCWRYVPSVSTDPAWVGLCDRCRDALGSAEEVRTNHRVSVAWQYVDEPSTREAQAVLERIIPMMVRLVHPRC